MHDPIAELKKRFPDWEFPPDAARDEQMGRVLDEMAQQLLPRVAARVGVSVDELRSRITIQLGTAPDVNGYTATFDGHTVIVINIALMNFLFKMVKVFVASLGIGEDEEHAIERPLPQAEVVSVCKALMDAFWEGRLNQQAGFWLADLGEAQIRVVTRILRLCESFALAHEFGHVIAQLLTEPVPEEAAARRFVTEFLETLPDLEETARSRMMGPWTEELCADLVGLNLVLSLSSTEPYCRHSRPERYLFDGIEVFHILQTMLTEYRDRSAHPTNITLGPSHPHGLLRARAARRTRSAAGASSTEGFQMGTTCYRFMKKVLSDIFDATPETSSRWT